MEIQPRRARKDALPPNRSGPHGPPLRGSSSPRTGSVPPYDIALTEHPDHEGVLAHRPDCPKVAEARERGKPVCTMLACHAPLSNDLPRHSCLDLPEPMGAPAAPGGS